MMSRLMDLTTDEWAQGIYTRHTKRRDENKKEKEKKYKIK